MKALNKLFTLVLLLLLVLPVSAQEYISSSRCADEDCFADLGGDMGVMVVSIHSDLVIRVANKSQKVDINQRGKRDDGLYVYEVVLDAKETKTPKIEVSRRGSVYKTELIAKIKPDFFVAYKLEEVLNPIRSDEQTRSNDAIFDAKLAAVELTSVIKDLKVSCDPALKATVSSELSKADPNIMVYSITIPIANYQEIKARKDVLIAQLDSLNKVFDNSTSFSEELEKAIDGCEAQVAEADVLWNKVSNITVYGQGTNYVTLDVSDLYPKKKKCFAILPLIIEKEVFVTECSSFMREGGNLFSMRKYKEAKAAYTSALNAKDLVQGMKPAIEESISLCDSCMMYENYAALSIKKIIDMKKAGNATQESLVRYATAAVDFLEILNKYNEDEFYSSRSATMKKLIDDLPLKIKFTIVEWETLNEGGPISGVEVWTFNGDYVVTVNSFTSDRKFKKMVNGEKHAYQQVGVSDANGKVEIELDRKNLPKGIIFRPGKDSEAKVKYMPFTDLMRQAHGTYTEKQFRLKMFVK